MGIINYPGGDYSEAPPPVMTTSIEDLASHKFLSRTAKVKRNGNYRGQDVRRYVGMSNLARLVERSRRNLTTKVSAPA